MRENNRLSGALVIVLALLALPACLAAQEEQQAKQRITLQNIFATGLFGPGLGQVTWMPDSQSFIYTFQGAIWRYDVAGGEATRLIAISDLQTQLMEGREQHEAVDDTNATGRFSRTARSLSPDGRCILGAFNNDIYIYNLETGEGRFITNDPEPEEFQTFSPDNTKVAYAKGGDLYVTDVADGQTVCLTDSGSEELWNGVADWVYEEELGVRRSFWWSPDSQKIAYLQFDTSPIPYFYIIDHLQLRPEPEGQKFPLAGESNSIVKLGVVGAAGGRTQWIDLGEEDCYIARVDWTHSGSELTYQWLNRPQNRLELRFADPESGESRAAVVEESDTWVNIDGSTLAPVVNLVFLEDDSFLWGSERSGFRHVYYYDASGSLVRQLTDGQWQIEGIEGLSADQQTVYFSSRATSPLEQQLYCVGIDGTGFRRITQEEGTYRSTLSPDGNYFVSTHSTITIQPETALYGTSDGAQISVLMERGSVDETRWFVSYPEIVTIQTDDGDTLYGMIMKPVEFDESRKYPVVIYVYGGPGVQTVTNAWAPLVALFNILTAKDYIVFALDNRGSWGRGHEFESRLHLSMGTIELDDQVLGVEYLKGLPYVDGENIGITGGSYGGEMTMLALFKAPEHFKVGVAMSPGGNLAGYDTIYSERYMSTPEDNPEGYRIANPATHAAGLEGHLYIQHGMMDNNAHVQGVFETIEALLLAGKDFKLMLYPQERHGTSGLHHFTHQWTTAFEFFDQHLKAK